MNSNKENWIVDETGKIDPSFVIEYTEKFNTPIGLEFPTSKEVSERLNQSTEKIQETIWNSKATPKSENPDIPEDKLVTVDIQEVTDAVTGRDSLKKDIKQIINLK